MGKRWKIRVALIFVAAAGLIVWLAARTQEPAYQGKPLSFWLARLYAGERSAEEPVRKIGTNALPVLIEMIQARDSRLKKVLMSWANKQTFIRSPFKPAGQLQQEAVCGYLALGPLASPQVPSLARILTNE